MRRISVFPLRIPRALVVLRKVWTEGYGHQPVLDEEARYTKADNALHDNAYLTIDEEKEDTGYPARHLATCQCGSSSWLSGKALNERARMGIGCGFCAAADFQARIYTDHTTALHLQHRHALMFAPGLMPGAWGGTMIGEQVDELEGRDNFTTHLLEVGLPAQWCPFLNRIDDRFGYGMGNIECSPYACSELFPREELFVYDPKVKSRVLPASKWASLAQLSEHIPEVYQAFLDTSTNMEMSLVLSQLLKREHPEQVTMTPPIPSKEGDHNWLAEHTGLLAETSPINQRA